MTHLTGPSPYPHHPPPKYSSPIGPSSRSPPPAKPPSRSPSPPTNS